MARHAEDGDTPESKEQRLLGVILTGGRSTRMGRDKALLPHPDGGTFLDYVAALLRACCGDVIISGRHTLQGVRTLPDPVPDQGPAIGVAAAVQEAHRLQFAAALVMAVDMPRILPEDLHRLINGWEQPQQLVTATFADGSPEPLLAIYPVTCLDALQSLTTTQHRSLFRWLSQQSTRHAALPLRAAANVNTSEEWTRFQSDQS